MSIAPQTDPSLPNIIDKLRGAVNGKTVTVADILDAIGDASYAPALLVPALILVTPLSGIFGLPTFLALIMLLIASQALLQRRHLWLPARVMRRGLAAEKFAKALEFMDKPARWIDGHSRARLRLLVARPLSVLPFVLTIAVCLAIPPMEVLPMVSSIAAFAIVCMTFGLIARDGLYVLCGYAVLGLAVFLVARTLLGTLA